MKSQELTDVILKSAYFARFLTDPESPELDRYADNSLDIIRQRTKATHEETLSGNRGQVRAGSMKATYFLKKHLGKLVSPFFTIEKKPKINSVISTKQQRHDALEYLASLEKFYENDESQIGKIKDYLTEIYNVDFEKGNSNLHRAKKGYAKVSMYSLIAAIATGASSQALHMMDQSVKDPAVAHGMGIGAALAIISVACTLNAGMFQYFSFQNNRDLKTIKKIFDSSKNTKKELENTEPEKIKEILNSSKNKIVYLREVPYKVIRDFLKFYRKDKEKSSFDSLLEQYLK